jgi:sec-independent protein translocase protein TatC
MSDAYLPRDKELPIEEHLIELRKRLLVIVFALGIITIIAYPFTDEIIFGLRDSLVPEGIKIIILNPIEYFLARAKLAAMIALIIGIPLVLYEIFKFMRPGLFPSEERFFLTVIPSSIVLFSIGATISYFTFTPLSLRYLITTTESVAIPTLVLGRFISFITFMLLAFGLIFQLPLVIWLLLKAELITVQELKEKRKLIYIGLGVGGIIVAPDPTPITPLLVAISLIVVFEVSLFLADKLKG